MLREKRELTYSFTTFTIPGKHVKLLLCLFFPNEYKFEGQLEMLYISSTIQSTAGSNRKSGGFDGEYQN